MEERGGGGAAGRPMEHGVQLIIDMFEDISNCDTSNVTDMCDMFKNAASFNQHINTSDGGWEFSKRCSRYYTHVSDYDGK